VKHDRDDHPWPASPREQREALRSLVEDLSRSGTSETLIVDGLDEADMTDGLTILQALPCDPPLAHIHWVFGCREQTSIFEVAKNRCGGNHIRLTAEDEWNLDDAAA
jgi:hypothetical protein